MMSEVGNTEGDKLRPFIVKGVYNTGTRALIHTATVQMGWRWVRIIQG